MNTIVTLDLETTGLDWQKDTILLLGYRLDRKGDVLYDKEILRPMLSDPDVVLSGHNIKFDALFLANAGFDIQCHLEDTRVLAYLNWPEATSHSLKALVKERLRRKPTELSDIKFKPLKKDKEYLTHEEYFQFSDGEIVRKDLLSAYHRDDIINVDRLRAILTNSEWFTEVEMPLTKMLFEMELYGCPIDTSGVGVLDAAFTERERALLEQLLHSGAVAPPDKKGKPQTYNPNSTAHNAFTLQTLGHNLEEICEKTAKGAYCVDKKLLKSLNWKGDRYAGTLLQYRKYSKLLSTYIRPFSEGASRDGRIHGSINQAGSENADGDGSKGTNTGRLSSSDPNLQNIPSRTKEGKEVRKLFISSHETTHMFDSDLSQIEPRLIAHYTQAPKLLTAYANGVDTHGLFANDIFPGCDHTDKHILETNPRAATERFIGKSSWLATVYGCSYRKLLTICENFSDDPLDLDLEPYYPMYDTLQETCNTRGKCLKCKKHLQKNVGKDARKIYAQWMFFKNVQDTFKAKNPELFAWRDTHVARTRRIGYVVTLGGRRIDVKGLDSADFKERSSAERRAVNYLIQGSAADTMKLTMVRFQNEFVKPGYGRAFCTVHDEILGEMYDKKHIVLVKDIMENTMKLRNVLIKADSKLVANWGDKS